MPPELTMLNASSGARNDIINTAKPGTCNMKYKFRRLLALRIKPWLFEKMDRAMTPEHSPQIKKVSKRLPTVEIGKRGSNVIPTPLWLLRSKADL